MKITFNSINAVTGVITNDEPLRQGNVGANTLTATFEGKSNLAYTATFNYTRSDDGRLKDIPLTPTANAGEYYYKFSNPWFFAVYGETTLTVYLKNSANEIVASGQITFSIEQTDFDDDPNITYSEYELLLDAITAKQDKFEIYNVRGYNSLALAEADPGLDDGQIVIIRDGGSSIYQVQAGELVDLTVNKATRDSLGNVIKDSYVSAVYPTYNNTTDKLFIETYSVEDGLLANNEVILPKATTTINGLMAKEDKVKVDALATTYETQSHATATYETKINSDAKIKYLGEFPYNSQGRNAMLDASINAQMSMAKANVGSGSYLVYYILRYNWVDGANAIVFRNSDNGSSGIKIYNKLIGETVWSETDTYKSYNSLASIFQPKLTFDTTPTTGSTNPVTSGGIKTYVDTRVAVSNFQNINDVIKYAESGVLTKRTPYYVLKHLNSSAIVINAGGIHKYNSSDGGTTWTETEPYVTDADLALKQSLSEKGQPNGYASLDSGGKVPSTQLPSYVDDVLEYANLASFPATGSASVIYVALDTNLTYRWSGSAYVEISPSLALGETSSTAYRGDKGKTAYDHSQVVSGNPHNVTKADVGLDNVINPNAYNNIDISTDLDTIAVSGIYTCYGTANGVPSADYSWFVLHLNSGVGTAYAKQIAFAYDGKIYVRFKNTTWGSWAFIQANTLGFDNTIKNILTATNLQGAIDELTDDLSSIDDKISSSASSSNKVLSASEVVKIMPAPESTTLTDEQITQIINGVFMQGTFLGYINPTLFPCVEFNGIYYGMIIGRVDGQTYTEFRGYAIDKTTKVVTSSYYTQRITASGAMNIQVGMIQGKQYPNFPISTTDSYINKYVNGTWTWSLEAPTPNIVSLNLETILAGTDVNFSCSGSGTSESPYIIMPKANIPHRYNRYQLTANTEPTDDTYITLQANGLEKCQVEVTHSVAFTTHHYYVTVLDNNGNPRARVNFSNTISRAIWDVSGTKFIIVFDVNGDNVYYSTPIA